MLIKVEVPQHTYNVRIGEDIDSLGSYVKELTGKRVVYLISNKPVWELYGAGISLSFSKAGIDIIKDILEDGEKEKTLSTVESIYDKMSTSKVERFTPVIAFGGGVVGDIAAYTASTYLRGLPFINVPTTIVSQVDSSIGGKTGVNLECGKNLVGTFYQPVYVHSDVELLKSLPEREFIGGLAEVVKHAVIHGEGYFKYLEDNSEGILSRNPDVLEIVVAESVKIKSEVVRQDEKESGLRRILNLGHTLGHALETLTGYGELNHGEGVSVGIIAASRISEILNNIDKKVTERIERLLSEFGLPVSITSNIDSDAAIDIMYHDKKVRDKNIEFVLPEGIGSVASGIRVEKEIIKQVIDSLKKD